MCSNRENTRENPDKNICLNITYERNKRVINGYKNAKGEQVKGLGGNLKYYVTDFIKTEKSIDDLRYKFINMCDDLLCIKENTFEEVKQTNDKIKIFEKGDKNLAILYDMFYFDEFKDILKTLNKPISIYVFSYYKLSKKDFGDLKNDFEIEQIPDPILEVYEKIFGL